VSAEVLHLDIDVQRGAFRLALDETLALDGVTAILGRSGSGKTTLLRAIAGLEMPRSGQIALGETVWFDAEDNISIPAHRRDVGYVFQDARLFEHLDVRGNLDFAAKRALKAGRAPDLDWAVHAAGLAPLIDRSVSTLSGGETRRVALARALLTCPDLLLLDEPLSGLDRAARREILPFLRALPRETACPILYVSHDMEEVAALAQTVVVLDAGKVAASGPIMAVAHSLDLGPLTGSDAPAALVESRLSQQDEAAGLTRLSIGNQGIALPYIPGLGEGEPVRLFVDARDVSIALARPDAISIRNILSASVAGLRPGADGVHVDVELVTGASRLWSRITRSACEDLSLSEGKAVFALIKSVRLAGDL
jgi:molybdate transport system ATP-binding protein